MAVHSHPTRRNPGATRPCDAGAMSWTAVITAATASHGVIHLQDAARIGGLREDSARRRARLEGWSRPFPSVLVVPGLAVNGRRLAAAAAIAFSRRTGAGAGASASACGGQPDELVALTRSTALAFLGMQRSFPTTVELAITNQRALAPRPRLHIVRSSLLTADDIASVEGVPVLRGPALARDLAAVRDQAALRAMIVDLRVAGHLDLAELGHRLPAWPRFPGKAVLRRALDDLLAAGRTDSPLEYRIRAGLRDAGIPLDPGQVAVPGTRLHLDLGIAAIRFGIEVDSMSHHSSRSDLERDAQRANAVASSGAEWAVLHATWQTVEQRWQRFVEQVRSVVTTQSQRHLGRPWPT